MPHAEDYLLYPQNIGLNLCIDETSLSKGEVYTIVSNNDRGCKKGSLVAIIKGTKSDIVFNKLNKIRAKLRYDVKTITLDLSHSMAKIARESFPNAMQIIDRFHVQKLINDAVQDTRIKHRWIAQAIEDKFKEKCEKANIKYKPTLFDNDETVAQLFTRSRYALMMDKMDWTKSQVERMKILFDNFPDVEIAYDIAQNFRKIMNARNEVKMVKKSYNAYVCRKEIIQLLTGHKQDIITLERYIKGYFRVFLVKWYDYVDKKDVDGIFKSVKETFKSRHENILNYFLDGFSNARAEALNSKIKDFRRNIRGVKNQTFFLFRLQNLLA